MSKRFSVHEDDKRLHIVCEDEFELEISIDYDDVFHPMVLRKAKQLCKILDEHWPKS